LIYFEVRLTLHGMKRLTTSEVAKRLDVAQVTVNVWCLQGRFPKATREATPRGPVWTIPEDNVANFVKPDLGRPPRKPASTEKTTSEAAIAGNGRPGRKREKK